MNVDERERFKRKRDQNIDTKKPETALLFPSADEDEVTYVKKNGHVFAPDGCDLLELDLSDPACRQFCLFAQGIALIGIRYKPFDSKLSLGFRFCYQGLVVLLCVHTGICDFYNTIYYFDARTSGTTYQWIVVVVQALISQIFLTKTQFNLGVPRFFHILRHYKIDDGGYYENSRTRSIVNNTRRFVSLFVTAVVSCCFYALAIYFGIETEVIHENYKYSFYFEQLRYIRLYLIYYNMGVWNLALHTYMCLSNIMYWEAKKFNRKLKELKGSHPGELVEKLEEMILIHTHLNRCVRELDLIFKVYAFLIVCSVIPATLFTFAMVATKTSVFGVLLCLPSLFMCLYGYYGATLTPATLHEELSKSKATLCMNNNVWVPFDEKVNKVAHTLVMHLDQADLGISLWGFALVTKPMILTTISVMMTCLAFFLELKPKVNNVSVSSNSTQSS